MIRLSFSLAKRQNIHRLRYGSVTARAIRVRTWSIRAEHVTSREYRISAATDIESVNLWLASVPDADRGNNPHEVPLKPSSAVPVKFVKQIKLKFPRRPALAQYWSTPHLWPERRSGFIFHILGLSTPLSALLYMLG